MRRVIPTLVLTAITITAAAFLWAREHTHATPAAAIETEQGTRSPIPMILQETDGDRLVHRAGPLIGVPFTIKVDGQFGNSEDFFVFAETLGPQQTIPFHKHANAEELLIFQEPGAEVMVGDKRGMAGAQSVIFIPRDTWISATNTSRNDIHTLAIFSRHGFESYMRAIGVKLGEPLTPLNQEELTRLRTAGHAMYWDTSKGRYPPGVAHP
jgi:quercetin dioxygenase-like cupin family protein